MDDTVPVRPLGHGVVGKALADGVGWVEGRGLLPLWNMVGGWGGWLSALDFFVCANVKRLVRRKETNVIHSIYMIR